MLGVSTLIQNIRDAMFDIPPNYIAVSQSNASVCLYDCATFLTGPGYIGVRPEHPYARDRGVNPGLENLKKQFDLEKYFTQMCICNNISG